MTIIAAACANWAVVVGGSVLIEGGLVRLLADQGAWSWSTSANIISSAGAVSGTFDEVSSNLAFLTPELLYRANGVDLLVRRNDVRFRDVALTPNQHATAGALENLAVTNPIFKAALDGSRAGLQVGLDTLSGEVHASLAAAATNDLDYIRSAALNQLPHSVQAVGHSNLGEARGSGVSVWGQGIAGFATRRNPTDIAGLRTDTKGFATGINLNVADIVNVGALFGYLDTDANIRRLGSRNNQVTSLHAGGYLGAELGALRLRAGGSYGWYETDATRAALLGTFSDSLRDTYKGRAWQAFGEIGFGVAAGDFSFEPYAGITRVNYRTRAIDEQGGAAALDGFATYRKTITSLGVKSALQVMERKDGRQGFVRLSGAWRYDIDNDGANAVLHFTGSQHPFLVKGAEPGKNMGIVDFAIDLPAGQNLDIGISYGGQFSNIYAGHSAKANLTLRF
jgi:fibronectin-binding autotransporter adhesin